LKPDVSRPQALRLRAALAVGWSLIGRTDARYYYTLVQ
jgi:hypothetical protein